MKIQSFSDIITNSSSELFVFNDGKTEQEVVELLNSLSDNWRNEYNEPISVENAENSDINTYISQTICHNLYFKAYEKKHYADKHPEVIRDKDIWGIYSYDNIKIDPERFDKTDCYAIEYARELGGSPEEMFRNWDRYNPFVKWNDEDYDNRLIISNKGYEIIKEKFGKDVLLFSLDENPDGEFQDTLEYYASRHHLG